MDNKKTYKESGLSLIPFLAFIILLVGSGIVLSIMGVERPFWFFLNFGYCEVLFMLASKRCQHFLYQ